MIQYMLDTNICIYIINQKPQKVFDHFQTLQVGQVCISSITLSEMQFGVSNSSKPEQNQNALNRFLGTIAVLDYPSAAAPIYGNLRAGLKEKGSIIGANDMLIAAHALSQGIVLVTNNVGEFSRIDKLKIENWV